MSREENLMILRLLQEGSITAEQAAALLAAVDRPGGEATVPDAAAVPPPPPPPPPADPAIESEALARARAKIAAAREKVAGVQEQLAAAEEKIDAAEGSPNPMGGLTDALKDLPGMRSVVDAIKGIDANRLASDARRQARRLGRTLRDSLDSLPRDLSTWTGSLGEPDLRLPLEAVVAIPDGATLRLRNPAGLIEVQGADVPECRVAATVEAWGTDLAELQAQADAISLDVDTDGGAVSVLVAGPAMSRRLRCDVKVFVPAGIGRVTAVSPAGDLTVRGLAVGGVVLASTSGALEVAECGGDVTLETASGSTVIQGIGGNVVARSTSGDIRGVRISGKGVSAKTQSGDVSLEGTGAALLELETVSGDIRCDGTAGGVVVRTVSGDVALSGEVGAAWDGSLRTVSGEVALSLAGADGGRLEVETVSGDIVLRCSEAVSGHVEARSRSGKVSGMLPGGVGLDSGVDGAGGAWSFGSGDGIGVVAKSLSGDIAAVVVEP